MNKVIRTLLLLGFLWHAHSFVNLPAIAENSSAKTALGGETVYFDHVAENGELQGGAAQLTDDEHGLCSAELSDAAEENRIASVASTIINNGPVNNRVDLLFLGDGYTSAELGQFSDDVAQAAGQIFEQTPLYEYANYFNVHRLDLASNESGIDNDPVPGSNKDTVLDSTLWCQGTPANICTNVSKAWQFAATVPGTDHLVVLANSSQAGGAGYPFSDLAIVTARQSQVVDSLVHQLGHSLADLADEYDTGSWPIYTGFEPAEPNVSAQTAEAMQSQRLKWYRWLGADFGASLGGLVGVFEGAMGHQQGIYRPTLNSKMRTLDGVFNLPSIESFIMQTYRLVRPIDDATPANATLTGRDTLFVVPLRPRTYELSVQWYIDDQPISGATSARFRPDDFRLPNGLHTFSVIVSDRTPWVRDEDFRARFMTESRSWNVTIDQRLPIIVTQPRDQTVYPGDTALFTVGATGVDLQFQWYRNGVIIPNANLTSHRTPVVTRGDNGALYHVVVSNIAGFVTSSPARLIIGNRPPSIGSMPNLDLIRGERRTVAAVIIDPDGDSLQRSVAIESNGVATGAEVSIDNSSVVTVRAGNSFLGSFNVRVSATDGFASASQTFAVTVRNQLPILTPIADQQMHWKTPSLTVPVIANDGDGEPLVFTAALAPGQTAPVSVTVSGNSVVIDPAADYLGNFTVRVGVSDGLVSLYDDFTVLVYNRGPILEVIPDQRMHWIKDESRVLTLPGTDPDGEAVTFTAEVMGNVEPMPILSLSGNQLTIDPALRFLGKFGVRVTVSDGTLSSSRTFTVTTYNSAPDLEPLCNIAFHSSESPYEVALVAEDPDDEPLTFEAFAETFQLLYSLDQQHNFAQPASGWNYNAIGLEEKYLVGDKRGASTYWYMILPSGELYEFAGSLAKSRLVGRVPEAVHRNPKLIVDVPPQPAEPPVDLVVTDNIVQISPQSGYKGTFLLRARARDEQLFDEESCLVTVYSSVVRVTPLAPVVMHWREEARQLNLAAEVFDGRGNGQIAWSAFFADVSQAYSLDQQYNFRTDLPRESYTADNAGGRNEKYLLGTISGGKLGLFAILPNGELYSCPGSIATATVTNGSRIASLPPVYYRDPSLLVDAPTSVAPPIALTINDSLLTIEPELGFIGKSVVTLAASVGGETDWYDLIIDVYDNAPEFPDYEPVQLPWNAGTAAVELQAADMDPADLPHLTFTAQLGGQSTWLSQLRQYNLAVNPLAIYPNRDGWRERHLLGVIAGEPNDLVVLPGNALYVWGGSLASSELIAHLPDGYYASPALLNNIPVSSEVLPEVGVAVVNGRLQLTLPEDYYTGSFFVHSVVTDGNRSDRISLPIVVSDGPPVISPMADREIHWRTDELHVPISAIEPENEEMTYSASLSRMGGGALPVDLNLVGNIVGLNPKPHYLGSFNVTVGAADARHTTQRQFGVRVYNNPPELPPIDVISMSYLQDKLEYLVTATDTDAADQNQLRYKAYLGTPEHLARQLDQLYNFHISQADRDNTDRFGYGEKYVSGTSQGNPVQFVLLPNGELHHWNGAFPLGEPVSHLPGNYYSNPAKLVDVVQQPALPSVQISTTGDKLVIDPQVDRFIGNFPVTLAVTDGQGYGLRTIYVAIGNSWPRLNQPADVNQHWSGFPLTVVLTASDADGDPLTYSASVANPAVASISLNANTLVITPRTHYVGDILVNASVSDGTTLDRKTFTVRSTNTPPTIAPAAPIIVGWRETATAEMQISDADNDPLTITAAADPASASLVNVRLNNRTVTVEPREPYVGVARVYVNASDGPSTTFSILTISFINRMPTIAPIGRQSMHWREESRRIDLQATDPDNDPITFSAQITEAPTAATVSVVNNLLTVMPTRLADTFVVTAYASDGPNRASTSFRVNIVNGVPRISPIANQSIPWRKRTLSVPIETTDPDGDPLTISAVSEDNTIPVRLTATGTTLNIERLDNKLGTSWIQVTSTDGFSRATGRFSLTVTNTPPELDPVADQIMAADTASIAVELNGSDAEEDPLTYAAELVSAERVAFELDQLHNFDRRNGSSQDNLLRLEEKYLWGNKNSTGATYTYVIFPSGKLYEWRGALSRSVYLALLPAAYYLEPTRLIDVGAPAAPQSVASVTINGQRVTITPQQGYNGRFWVRAAVTDTLATTVRFFTVTVEEQPEPGDGHDHGCEMSSKLHPGEYNKAKQSFFTAEGRVGDSATNPGNQTFEIDVSRTTAGPFAQGETSNYRWLSNRKVDFQISFSKQTSLVTFTVDGQTVRHQASVTTSLTDIFLRVRAGKQGSSVLLEDLMLNGQAVAEDAIASDSDGSVNTLQITAPLALRNDFTLNGKAMMVFNSDQNKGVKNSELAFQVSFAHVDENEEKCGGEDDNGRKVTICHLPNGDWTKARTIRISVSALEAHLAHGDVIGECPNAPSDPGDGGGSCELKKIISSPNYSLWNSFLAMLNILTLTNPAETDLPVRVTFYSIRGDVLNQRWVVVPARNQLDIIVNDLPGFVPNSYGVMKLEFDGVLDGNMMFYKLLPGNAGYDFAFGIPLADANFGNTAVGFNTFQPSLVPAERANLVANWLSIVNLDSQAQRFTIYSYDLQGRLIARRERELAPFGRDDMDGGHDLAGPNVVGYHKIVPHNVTTEYIAQLTRFGGDAPAGFAQSEYKFAFPLMARLGQSDPIYVPMSNKFGEYNWIEVINILDRGVGATLNYFGKDGRILETQDAWIEPNAQVHFDAGANLNPGEVGYAEIVPREPFSLVAQSMGYMRDPRSGSVTSVYGSQARRALPCLQSGSYNLFLGMQNWLLVSNTTNTSVEATIQVSGPNLQSERTITLAPRASVHVPIHVQSEFGARPDTYGLLAVQPSIPSVRLFAEVMRARFDANGKPEFSAPIPVR